MSGMRRTEERLTSSKRVRLSNENRKEIDCRQSERVENTNIKLDGGRQVYRKSYGSTCGIGLVRFDAALSCPKIAIVLKETIGAKIE